MILRTQTFSCSCSHFVDSFDANRQLVSNYCSNIEYFSFTTSPTVGKQKCRKSNGSRKKQKVEGEEDHECKTQLSPPLSNLTAARRKYNIHFATFWHLTHLASVCSNDSNIGEIWYLLNSAGRQWKSSQEEGNFHLFDYKLTSELHFMEDRISNRSSAIFEEKCSAILQNFDKCLTNATTLTDQVRNDEVDALGVCVKLVDDFAANLKNFKMLPLLWGHLFVSHIYQLLLLARNCCQTSDTNGAGESFATFASLLDRHANSAAELREHFFTASVNSINSINSIESNIFSPTISLDALIVTLSAEAKCAAQQIPTAVTSIVHDYCYIDPFNLNDAEFVKMKFITTNK